MSVLAPALVVWIASILGIRNSANFLINASLKPIYCYMQHNDKLCFSFIIHIILCCTVVANIAIWNDYIVIFLLCTYTCLYVCNNGNSGGELCIYVCMKMNNLLLKFLISRKSGCVWMCVCARVCACARLHHFITIISWGWHKILH